MEVVFTTFSIKQENNIGQRVLQWRTTSFTWDNFDINTKAMCGTNTIHHTYGICYQNISCAAMKVLCIVIQLIPETIIYKHQVTEKE